LGFFDAVVLGCANRRVLRELRSMFCCPKKRDQDQGLFAEADEEDPSDSLVHADLAELKGSLSFIP